ncbi:lipid-A-disaccharide synthase [Alteromonas pelagimontana]|uniref:Lipid-A-disaccharide synthase n=1 Tax=Alteromonas pelagimontana TaxID=1858656 RepID=A0A6M4MFC1_9ALTE|nr:lipid-A-disaccharide synthase [Alteromonas pelagimontana]QJR81783.1 lipid-A-disaccharide synthase [Alteromonas pelagimontana]
MADKPLRIAIVAGEPSGDVLAAGMIAELKRRHPDAIIEGIGGDNMQAAGFRSLFDMETLSVMGLVEVLSHLPAILKVKKQLLAHFAANPPDVFVGIDAPDFNLRVERELKRRGIKTVHYVSPTIWAWRENRIHKIARATNRVLGLFPFEQAVYDKYQVPYTFVGHTMADAIAIKPDQGEARTQLGINNDRPILAVLPGSRGGELKSLLPVFVETMKRVKASIPDCFFVIPAANKYRFNTIGEYLGNDEQQWLSPSDYLLTHGMSREAMIASDVILLASGTATLEAMLCKRPMVAAYKLSPTTYKIMQYLYKAPFFALPNLLAGEAIVPELLQDDVNPQTLCEHLLPFFTSDNSPLIETFTQLHQALRLDADKKSAQAVLEAINE